MKDASLILDQAKSYGLNIQAIDGNLRVRPAQRITETLRNTIRQHKAELIEFLEGWEERAAIMEYDCGMTREQAEAAAFEDCTKFCIDKGQ